MSSEFYCDGQVKTIFPYVPKDVEWFIIGGPADANEAQVFRRQYPHCQVIGFEPNPKNREFQLVHNFPGELRIEALWDREEILKLIVPNENHRCGSIINHRLNDCPIECYGYPLDRLLIENSFISNIVLWIDIEGAEIECLKGCHQLLTEKRIKVINCEVSNETKEDIINLLFGYGYSISEEWNIREMTRTISDIIFTIK